MFRVIDSRGSGKTKKLMLKAKETNGAIICANPIALSEKAKAYGIIGIEFVSYSDFIEDHLDEWEEDKIFYIDELEMFMKRLTQHYCYKNSIAGYTLSEDD